jgi:pyruvate dehydrogenase E1 component beta subunit
MPVIQYWEAVNRALNEELARDQAVVLFGEDVAVPGGIFGVTRRLREIHGAKRVFDAPISEGAFMGAAVGAAMTGLRPVAEIMFMDFSLVAADQIINHAAKIRYLSRGQYSVPIVIRTQQGLLPGGSSQHSQSFEAIFTSVPGLKVVAAANPSDAYGLLKTAIRDDDPVMFIEHRGLYTMKGDVASEEFLEPLGVARTLRSGSDVTIVSWSLAVRWAEQVADALVENGLGADVIDLRSLLPWDVDAVEESVRKTRHLVIIHEAIRNGGFGAEIAATLHDRVGGNVRISRFGSEFVPMPAAAPLQPFVQPNIESIVAAIQSEHEGLQAAHAPLGDRRILQDG